MGPPDVAPALSRAESDDTAEQPGNDQERTPAPAPLAKESPAPSGPDRLGPMRAVASLTDGADGSPENWLISLLPVAQHIAVQSGFLQAGLILEADDDHAADFPVAEKVFADILAALTDERAEPLTRAVLDQLRAQQPGSPQALADILEAVIDTVEASSVAGSEVQSGGIPTGFADLDRLLGGLRPGMLYLVAGEPAVGKSTLALDLARSAAIRHQHSTVFFSTQSSSHDLTMKIASAEARIPVQNIRQGLMREEDWIRLARTMADLVQAPLALACAGHLTVQTLSEHLTEEVELVLVDTVNAIRVPHRREVLPREQEIGIVISDLKALAIDLDVPVVVTASLNRGPSYRTDRIPRLDDVRDSGQLVDVADVVLLLHRPDMAEKESPRAGEADFIVAKSRLTPTDTITVAFQGHYSRFVDMAT